MYLVPSARAAFEGFEAWLRQRFDFRLRQLTLYGSLTSDAETMVSGPVLNVFVVISGVTDVDLHDIAHCRAELLAKHGVVIRPVVMSTESVRGLAKERSTSALH